MDDARFGSAIRSIRQRRGWRQRDLAEKAEVSASTISRLERGHPGSFSLDTIRAVARALDVRVDLAPRWRAGDLDRLLNARHSALHELVATWFGAELPAWVLAPEVSFNVFGDRGVIDLVAWHPGRRALLVIELKTDVADVNELLGTLDKKRRRAAEAVRDRGWDPASVSVWLIVAGGRTNRARLAAHRAMLRAALPGRGTSHAVLAAGSGRVDRRAVDLGDRGRSRVGADPAGQGGPMITRMLGRGPPRSGRAARPPPGNSR